MKTAIPIVSVIVPVYNAEAYLGKCIRSILSQTFQDYELLIIDDGSTDGSGAICDKLCLEDSRVKVIHKANGGVSSARNIGITEASGKWIVFVDADDIVSSDYLVHLYEKVADCDDNLLVFGSYYVCKKNKKVLLPQTLSAVEAANYILNNGILALSAPYAKMYSLKILREYDICFPNDINMGEDGIFLQRYLNVVEKVLFISDVDYYVNSTEGSLSTKIFPYEREWSCFVLWKKYITDYVNKFLLVFPNPQQIIWNNRVGNTFLRCMFSVAGQTPQWSLLYQWKTLKSVPRKETEEFRLFYTPQSFRDRIYKYLVAHRRFFIFALIINRRILLHSK